MNKLLISIVAILLYGCGNSEDADERYRNQVYQKVFNASQGYDLQPLGSGGFNRQGISGFTMMYEKYEQVDAIKARQLIVSLVEDILKAVNDASAPPLTIQNFDIYIFFFAKGARYPNTPDKGLAEVRLIEGDVTFAENVKGTFDLETIHIEPYAEAYEKVMGKKYEPSVRKI